MRVLIVLQPCKYSVSSVCLILDIIVSVQWYITVILICMYLVTYYSASFHVLTCHSYVLFHKVYAQIFCCFLIVLFVILLSFKHSLYILDESPLSDISFEYISSVCSLSSYCLKSVFGRTEILNYDKVLFINLFFSLILRLVS